MKAYIMGPAGGTKKYLVIVVGDAYNIFDTLQDIEYSICKTWQVHTELVRHADDLVGVNDIYLVDGRGLRRWQYGHSIIS